MHKFERFIIYPLLFVALFYAMTGGAGTDTLANPLDSEIEDVIATRKVQIYNDNNEIIGGLGSTEGNAILELYNSDGNQIVYLGASRPSNHGSLSLKNSKGDELVYVGPDNTNGHGLINIYDKYGEDYRSLYLR